MKKVSHLSKLSLFLLLISLNQVFSQNVAINTTGNAPDVSAMLDIVSSSKELLLPRVSLTSTTDATTIATPATSLLVYNTNASLTGDNADGVGYYYNAGTSGSPSWTKLVPVGLKWDDLRVDEIDVNLMNQHGKICNSISLKCKKGENIFTVHIEDLPKALYYINLSGKNNQSVKFIKL